MDAGNCCAIFDVTGIGPGQAVDCSEAKTVCACHNQPKEPPESRPACRAGAEGEGEMEMTEQQRAKSAMDEMVEKTKAAFLENMPRLILTADQLNLVDKWIADNDPKI